MLVSVVMASYNDKPEDLDAALRSVVEQGLQEWELVVVDDSTSAESIAVLEGYARQLGERMVYRRNQRRLGFVASMNMALGLAHGELIARMDGDDICLSDRFESQVSFLAAHPEVGILGGDMEIMSVDGKKLSVRRYKRGRDEIRKVSFFRNPLAHPTVMMRRSVLDEIGVYNPLFRKSEDYELWLRALKKGVVIENLDKVLIRYRVPEASSLKRNGDNWTFGMRAKLMHFSWRFPLLSVLGIGLSLVLFLMPAGVLNALYKSDNRTPYLYG